MLPSSQMQQTPPSCSIIPNIHSIPSKKPINKKYPPIKTIIKNPIIIISLSTAKIKIIAIAIQIYQDGH